MSIDHVLNTGDLIHFRGKGPISKLIQWATNSEFSHTAIYISDGFIIESSWGGVKRVQLFDKYRHADCEAFRHEDMTDRKAAAVASFVNVRRGKGYDYLGLAGIALHLLGIGDNDFDHKHRYWCSELAADAYLFAGLELECDERTYKVSPGGLARMKKFRRVEDYL